MPQLKGRIVIPVKDSKGFVQSMRDKDKNFTITYHGIVATCTFMGEDDLGYNTYTASIANTPSGIPICMPSPRRAIETQHWCWRELENCLREKQELVKIQGGDHDAGNV